MEITTNYYSDASLLEGENNYGVTGEISTKSFQMFDNCTQSIFEAHSDTMPPKEVIHLKTSLLNFYLRCYPGWMDHISRCIGCICCIPLHSQHYCGRTTRETDPINGKAPMWTISGTHRPLNEVAIYELQKLLYIPPYSLVLKVIELDHCSELLTFLPRENRWQVAVVMIMGVQASE